MMEFYGVNSLDILASVVSAINEQTPLKRLPPEHRVSCHRCGNIRKRKIICPRVSCPHIFCGRCAEKMRQEHGVDVFMKGCPVCHELCCCHNKTVYCDRKNHCYRKCPATKGKSQTTSPFNTIYKSKDFERQFWNSQHTPALDILAAIVTEDLKRTLSPGTPLVMDAYEADKRMKLSDNQLLLQQPPSQQQQQQTSASNSTVDFVTTSQKHGGQESLPPPPQPPYRHSSSAEENNSNLQQTPMLLSSLSTMSQSNFNFLTIRPLTPSFPTPTYPFNLPSAGTPFSSSSSFLHYYPPTTFQTFPPPNNTTSTSSTNTTTLTPPVFPLSVHDPLPPPLLSNAMMSELPPLSWPHDFPSIPSHPSNVTS